MDAKLVESYLDTIAELVVDEDKIVTYKSLSRSLGIHVNTAKQLLNSYLTKKTSNNLFPISATFLVAGKVLEGNFNITIVNEADLERTCENFVEITSQHVYSVQKAKTLKDIKVLCGTDNELSDLKKSNNLVINCSKGLIKLKHEAKKKIESYEEQNKKIIKQALVLEKPKVNVVESNKKTGSKASQNVTEPPKKLSPPKSSEKVHTNVKKPGGNIVNLFAKAVEKNANKFVTKSEKNFQNEPKEHDIAIFNKVEDVDLCELEQGTSEKKNESKDNLKKKNKRKRIQMLSDSDESSHNDADEDEENLNICAEYSLSQTENLGREKKEEIKEFITLNKKKRRKVVDRTVMNEEGYLETKKEIVFETDSENELEQFPSVPKEQSKTRVENSKGVQSAGTAKKQSSLLTFFKKT